MPQTLIPHIPEDAPFTAAQRAWLNGFLAGLYSNAPAPATHASEPLRVALLYGSQTGTAEGLARKLAKELKSSGLEIVLNSLDGYVPATLAAERHAIFIVSTHGEGEAPDAAEAFFQQLCVENFPLLGNLAYALLALGDSHYEHFCQFGKDLDTKLQRLGATSLLDRVDCDVDVDAPYAAWKETVRSRLIEIAKPSAPATATTVTASDGKAAGLVPQARPSAESASIHTRDNPFPAPIVEKRALTHPSSSKLTIHLDFNIADSQIRYEAGDACGIVPQNCPRLVNTVLDLLPFSGDERVEVPKVGGVSLREALLRHFAITRLTRKMVTHYADLAQCGQLHSLLQPEQQAELERYLDGRDLIDLLEECPGALQSPEDLIKMLPRLVPRLYSISSSPAAHAGRLHATVSVVRYRTHDRDREGVCSTLLADRVDVGDCLPLYIQPNKKFRLPEDNDAPTIMIGPGTGIAPFRAFLHQRRAVGAAGENWLFFGERSATTDFLYREEITDMHADGHLTRLDTAFSRDQAKKVYVQDLMLKNAGTFWAWLEEGAFVYVCGNASRMAKDVDTALHRIAQEQGGMSPDAAEIYVQTLKDDRHYQRDIY